MYTVRFEGASEAEKNAINRWVPDRLNEVVRIALGIGDSLISRWFGNAAIRGANRAEFHAKRTKMHDYLLNQCQVLSFVKKPVGAKVDEALVEEGDFAQVIRSCFKGDPSGFVPSGIRVYLLGGGVIGQGKEERFNTVAHELSHRIIGTTDRPDPAGRTVYGKKNALRLAKISTPFALNCAENWGYFYQEVMERDSNSVKYFFKKMFS